MKFTLVFYFVDFHRCTFSGGMSTILTQNKLFVWLMKEMRDCVVICISGYRVVHLSGPQPWLNILVNNATLVHATCDTRHGIYHASSKFLVICACIPYMHICEHCHDFRHQWVLVYMFFVRVCSSVSSRVYAQSISSQIRKNEEVGVIVIHDSR